MPLPRRLSRHGVRVSALSLLCGLTSAACAEDPTEVVVEVYTDVPCQSKAAVAAGRVGELGDRPASAVSTRCDAETGYLGRVVLSPDEGDENAELAIEVRVRADQGLPEDCVAANNYSGCIVARRILNYIPGRTVHMQVDLRNPCVDTPCTQTTSCVALGVTRACVEARIDPTKCKGTCTDNDLVAQSPTPVDPCAPESNPCSDNATCQLRDEGLVCLCPDGYRNDPGDPETCVDLDECAEALDDCASSATCTNVPGSFQCECPPEKPGDGKLCQSNECTSSCGPRSSCQDTANGPECVCDAGFGGTGCMDIDECTLGTDNCDPAATCTNLVGSFDCECPGDPSRDGTNCSGIDECTLGTDNCHANATCTDAEPGFACACNAGYSGSGTECTDDDECSSGTDDCAQYAICGNVPGSFTCTCPEGFTGDGRTACTPLCALPATGLSAWWTGDTNATDRIAQLAGTLGAGTPGQEATVTAAGKVNGAFDLSGTDSFIEVADDPALNVGTGDFSLAFWLRVPSSSGSVYPLVDKRAADFVGFHVYLYQGGVGFQMNGRNFGVSPSISNDVWHLIAISVDRDNTTGGRLYVDGQVAFTFNPTGFPGDLNTTLPFRVGRRSYEAAAAHEAFFIDELQLYKVALSENEVSSIFAASEHGVCKLSASSITR